MNIIGLQLGHNATVALSIDSKIVAAQSQERFDYKKNSNAFPEDAIRWLLSEFKLKPGDIDYVAISGENIFPHLVYPKDIHNSDINNEKNFLKSILKKLYAELTYNLYRYSPSLIQTLDRYKIKFKTRNGFKLLKERIKSLGFDPEKIVPINHHVCHTYAAFYSLSRNKEEPAVIVTIDGVGDFESIMISIYDGRVIKPISTTPFHSSLGWVYFLTTVAMGFKGNEDEYKIMGLAPYAKPSKVEEIYKLIFKDIVKLCPNSLTFQSKIPTNRFDRYLRKYAFKIRFDYLAGALQHWLEEAVQSLIRAIVEKTKIRNFYFGGGVFMNVKLNKKIMEMPEVEKCNFMPSCGDESNAIGACYYVMKNKGVEPEPLTNLYLGPSYKNEEVFDVLTKMNFFEKYKITYLENIEEELAKLLADGNIIARFKGRAEWGARALGNRSILGRPDRLETFYLINDIIKQRDFWMPFAPAILEECQELYIRNPKKVEGSYMIVAFDTTPLGQEHLKAAIHRADKTARVQLVKKDQNPDFHKLISIFRELTGIGGVLNTSLNMHGYPLASLLEHALFTFENSGLRYMAIENYLLEKV